MKGNSRAAKRQEQHQAHNRKAGAGKYWKRRSNRQARRHMGIVRRLWVDGKVPIY